MVELAAWTTSSSVAKVAIGGALTGYLLDPTAGDFVAADNTRRTDASLRALAATTGQEVTYTCAPPGSGRRIGLGL